MEFDIGYGLVTHRGAGMLTTYGGLSMAEPDSRGVRLGGRIELGEWIDLSVKGERTTQAAVPNTRSSSTATSAGSSASNLLQRGERFFAPPPRFNSTPPNPLLRITSGAGSHALPGS